jgi:hypothetical protein
MCVAQCMNASVGSIWRRQFFQFLHIMRKVDVDDRHTKFQEQIDNLEYLYTVCDANNGADFWIHCTRENLEIFVNS